MNESFRGSRGFRNYLKPKDKNMSDIDEGDRLGDNAYSGETRNIPKNFLVFNDEIVEEKLSTQVTTLIKDTNPKDAVGVRKSPVSTVSAAVVAELGLAMLEGARKYGRHNYRVSGVRASVYWDALFRHLMAWWDFGQDDDPDSGLSHIVKAMACLCVLRDAQHLDNWVDDRPPPLPIELLEKFNKLAGEIIDKHPDAKDPFTHENTKL